MTRPGWGPGHPIKPMVGSGSLLNIPIPVLKRADSRELGFPSHSPQSSGAAFAPAVDHIAAAAHESYRMLRHLDLSSEAVKADVELEELIGHGASADVYRGYLPAELGLERVPVAIKRLKMNGRKSAKPMEAVIALEVSLLRSFSHVNIVKYVGFFLCSQKGLFNSPQYDIVTEWVPGGCIEQYLKKINKMDEKLASCITKQVLNGLSYLHSRRVIHRDLKPGNLLIDCEPTADKVPIVKIADFGMSLQVLDIANKNKWSCVGTCAFMAPEVVRSEKCSYSADIWSLGSCVFNFATGHRPFEGANEFRAMHDLGQNITPNLNDYDMSDKCRDFISKCWTPNWPERPTALQLLQHPFITEQQ